MNSESKKSNWLLWVGLAIPIIVVAVVIILSFLSQRGFTPQYDFLYQFNDSYDYCYQGSSYYYVSGGMVQQAPMNVSNSSLPECAKRNSIIKDDSYNRIYRYSVTEEKSYSLTLAEAQELKVDVGPASPAGENIQENYGSNAGIFEIFGGRQYNSGLTYYLVNSQKRIKNINIVTPANMGYYNFKFIGWIIK